MTSIFSTLQGLAVASILTTESAFGFSKSAYIGHRNQLPPFMRKAKVYTEDNLVTRGGFKRSKRLQKLQKLARRNNR